MRSLVWLLAAGALALPAVSEASTVRVERAYQVVYEAAPGEVNDVRVTSVTLGQEEYSTDVTLRDAGATLVAGSGCEARAEGDVVCHASTEAAFMFRLGDGDDRFSAAGVNCRRYTTCALVFGGSGNDLIVGSDNADALYGEHGNDTLEGLRGESLALGCEGDVVEGGRGDDRLSGGAQCDWLQGGPGADVLAGGTGFDTVAYTMRRQPVRADLAGDADDGASGERDQIRPDVERLLGGQGRDRLVGNARPNFLYGSGGDDILAGRGGADSLFGGDGSDRVFGGAGPDSILGGDTDGRGHEMQEPGRGMDVLFGGPGNDGFTTNDGNADRLWGGPGFDGAFTDSRLDTTYSVERVSGYSLAGRVAGGD